MRTKENLKMFGHVAKTPAERTAYHDQVSGTTSQADEDAFQDTLPKNQPSGNPEEIPDNHEPYVSWRTWFTQNAKNIIVLGVAIPLFGWFAYTFIDYGRDISILTTQYNSVGKDVDSLKTKYEDLAGKSVRAEVLINEIQKDLDRLEQRIDRFASPKTQ